MKKGFAPILIVLIVICLLIGAIVLSIFALNDFFQKPMPPTGNDEALSQPISKIQKIDIKFKNGSTIRLHDDKFVSTSGENLSGLQTILNSVPGIKIERLLSQSEESIANQKKSLESKTTKELPDLNLFYILTLPKEVNAQNLIIRLKSLPLVEDAYIAPEPAPLPAQIDETANWKTYTNEFFIGSKISFKYPNTLSPKKDGTAMLEKNNKDVFWLTSITKPRKQSFNEYASANDITYLNGRGLIKQSTLKIDGHLAYKNYIEAEYGRKEIQVLLIDPKTSSKDQAGIEDFENGYNIRDLDTTILPESVFDQILSTFQFL